MTKKIACLLCLTLVFTFVGAITIAQNNLQKSDRLQKLEKEKNELFEKNKKVPFNLEKEIIRLTDETQKDVIAKNNKQKYLEKVKNAPKDEKGNPILSNKVIDRSRKPRKDTGLLESGEQFFSTQKEREKYDFSNAAITDYSIIIAASYSKDKETGVIYQIQLDPNDIMTSYHNEYEFENKGMITLVSLEDNNNIVTFRCKNGEEGYFDVRNSQAVFERYKKSSD